MDGAADVLFNACHDLRAANPFSLRLASEGSDVVALKLFDLDEVVDERRLDIKPVGHFSMPCVAACRTSTLSCSSCPTERFQPPLRTKAKLARFVL